MAGIRSAMRSPMRSPMRSAMDSAVSTLTMQALAILRSFGSDAHVYLPGSLGASVSGLLTNNYTLADGSTGYSAHDGVAGLALDGMGSVGDELADGYVQYNTSGTSSSLPATITSIGAGTAGLSTAAYMAAGKTYRVSATWDGNTGGKNIRIACGGDYSVTGSTALTGTLTATIKATSSYDYGWVYVSAAGAGETFRVAAFTVREVTGIHATQSTTANKPAVRRGAYNLLTYSDSIFGGTGAWVLQGGAAQTANNALSPSGTMTATRIVADGTGINQGIYLSAVATVGATQTFSLWLKGAVGGEQVYIGDATNRIAVTLTTAWARYNTPGQVRASNHTVIYALNNTAMTFYASQAQLESGTTASDYTPTTSAAASNPSAGKYWWGFDGSNDYLALGSVPVSLTDDFVFVCAARVDSTANSGKLICLRGATSTPMLELAVSGGAPVAQLRDNVGTIVSRTHGSAITAMSVCTMWKVGTTVYLRVNGAQSGGSISTSGLGATTLLYAAIGAAVVGGTPGVWFQGAIGLSGIVKGTLTESAVLTIERLAAASVPNGPSF